MKYIGGLNEVNRIGNEQPACGRFCSRLSRTCYCHYLTNNLRSIVTPHLTRQRFINRKRSDCNGRNIRAPEDLTVDYSLIS